MRPPSRPGPGPPNLLLPSSAPGPLKPTPSPTSRVTPGKPGPSRLPARSPRLRLGSDIHSPNPRASGLPCLRSPILPAAAASSELLFPPLALLYLSLDHFLSSSGFRLRTAARALKLTAGHLLVICGRFRKHLWRPFLHFRRTVSIIGPGDLDSSGCS